jgi:putative peptide zinc metalloprotease protein
VRRLVVILAAALGCLALAAPAHSAGGADNGAVAVNTKDGSSVFRLAFHVTRVMGDTVSSTNAAVAYASCTDCKTVAVAIQVVLVMDDPSTFTPTNEAIAINYLCDLCDTLASAYQDVIQTGGPVHLTAEGSKQVAELRKQLRALRGSTLDSFALQDQISQITDQLQQVFATQLVVAGPPEPPPPDGASISTTEPAPSSSTTTTTRPASTTSTSTTPSTTTTSTTAYSTTTTSAP